MDWASPLGRVEVEVQPDGRFSPLVVMFGATGEEYDEPGDLPLGAVVDLVAGTLTGQ